MKHIKLFNTNSEYSEFSQSADYILPNVSFVSQSNKVYYAATAVNANNVIKYKASKKLVEGYYTVDDYGDNTYSYEEFNPIEFNTEVISHTFSDGIGIITFKEDITTINSYCFNEHGSEITHIDIPNSVTTINNGSFWDLTHLTSVTLPNSITTLNGGVFGNCNLKEITIPESVTSIGAHAFAGNSELLKITCLSKNAPTIAWNVFGGSESGESIPNKPIGGVLRVPEGSDYTSWLNLKDKGDYVDFYTFEGWSIETF